MNLPNLPIEVWWQILSFTDTETLWSLRCVSRAFLRYIEDKLVPAILATTQYWMSDRERFDIESHTPEWSCADESPVRALNIAAKETFLYAPFKLLRSDSGGDQYKSLSSNKAEDDASLGNSANYRRLANAKFLSIYKDPDMDYILQSTPKIFEELVLGQSEIRRHIIVSEDGQSLLVPIYLLWTAFFELIKPSQLETWDAWTLSDIGYYQIPREHWRRYFYPYGGDIHRYDMYCRNHESSEE